MAYGYLGQNTPNPATNNTTIDYTIGSAENVTIEVVDITGKVVFSKNNVTNNETINLSNLQTGVYLAKMVTETGVEETKKIIFHI